VEDWKRNTEYVGYSPYENVIVWFWKVRAEQLYLNLKETSFD